MYICVGAGACVYVGVHARVSECERSEVPFDCYSLGGHHLLFFEAGFFLWLGSYQFN